MKCRAIGLVLVPSRLTGPSPRSRRSLFLPIFVRRVVSLALRRDNPDDDST